MNFLILFEHSLQSPIVVVIMVLLKITVAQPGLVYGGGIWKK
jgi:hypothetical protein